MSGYIFFLHKYKTEGNMPQIKPISINPLRPNEGKLNFPASL